MARDLWVLVVLVACTAAQCDPPVVNPVINVNPANPATCTPGELRVHGIIDMLNYSLVNLADPVGARDAISKSYLEAALAASTSEEKEHRAVRVKTTADLTSFATQAGPNGTGHMIVANNYESIVTRAAAFDNISLAQGNRVLVDRAAWGAVDPGSGIYVVTQIGNSTLPWILTRAPDADDETKLKGGCTVFVTQGAAFADTGWVVSSDMHILDLSDLEWIQFSGGAGISAGTGLLLAGLVMSVLPDQVLDTLQITQQTGGSGVLIFEGPVDDTYELTLGTETLTADRTVYLPDGSGTLALGVVNMVGRVRAMSVQNLVGVVTSGGGTGIGHTLTSVALEVITTARTAEFDGVGLVLGDRVFIYGVKLPVLSDAGVYEVTAVGATGLASWVLTRATDLDESSEYYAGVAIVIQEGATQEGRGWAVTTTGVIVVDTTEPVWSPRPCELSAQSSQRAGTAECAMKGGDVTYTGVMTAHEHTVFAGAPGISITKAGPSDTYMKRMLIAASESVDITDVRFQNTVILGSASTTLWSSAVLSPHDMIGVAIIASKGTRWGDATTTLDQYYDFTNSAGMANVNYGVTGTRVVLDQVLILASDTFTIVADNGTTADRWANSAAIATLGCTWGDLTDTTGELNNQVFMGACDTCRVKGTVTDVAMLACTNTAVGVQGSTFREIAMIASDHCTLDSTTTAALDRVVLLATTNLAAQAGQMTDVVFAAVRDTSSVDIDMADGMVLARVFVGGMESINWQDSDPTKPTLLHRVALLGLVDPVISGDYMTVQDSIVGGCLSCGYTTPVGDEDLGVKIFRRTAILASTSSILKNTNQSTTVVQENILVAACQSCQINAGPTGTANRAFIGGMNLPNTCGDNSLTTHNLCAADIDAATIGMSTGAGAPGQIILSADTVGSFAWGNINDVASMPCSVPNISGTYATGVVECATLPATYNGGDSLYTNVMVMASGSGIAFTPAEGLSLTTILSSKQITMTSDNTYLLVAGVLQSNFLSPTNWNRALFAASSGVQIGSYTGITSVPKNYAVIGTTGAYLNNPGMNIWQYANVATDTCGVYNPVGSTVAHAYRNVAIVASKNSYLTNNHPSDLMNHDQIFIAACENCVANLTWESSNANRAMIGGIGLDASCGDQSLTTNKLCTNGITLSDGANITVDTTTGTTIATTPTQKLGFWGAPPVVQHSATAVTGNHTSGPFTAVAVDDESTFDGGLGGSAYTIHAIVAALIKAGFLAP